MDQSWGEIRSWRGPSVRRTKAAETWRGPASTKTGAGAEIHAVGIRGMHEPGNLQDDGPFAVDGGSPAAREFSSSVDRAFRPLPKSSPVVSWWNETRKEYSPSAGKV